MEKNPRSFLYDGTEFWDIKFVRGIENFSID